MTWFNIFCVFLNAVLFDKAIALADEDSFWMTAGHATELISSHDEPDSAFFSLQSDRPEIMK